MFNPFQVTDFNNTMDNIDEQLDDFEKKITIFTKQNGRKNNTYIIDWDIDLTALKTHLKTLKVSNGCNGTIKTIKYDGEDKLAVHLQGNKLDIVKEYLLNTVNIPKNDLVIKD